MTNARTDGNRKAMYMSMEVNEKEWKWVDLSFVAKR